jgi:tetratricopeptide (TPR) repeat protein
VEKERFVAVLKHYFTCTEAEAMDVISLKRNFPYSQLLHALSARVSKDHNLTDFQQELQTAAVYATDRSVLKDVMTHNTLITDLDLKSIRKTEKVITKAPEPKAVLAESLADEVMDDLDRLRNLKHNFELMFMDGSHGDGGFKAPVEDVVELKEENTPVTPNFARHRQSTKSKKERIIEAAKFVEASKETAHQHEETTAKSARRKTNQGETIIDEIVSTKQPIEPESEKQKEQLEIIEQFIKTQPSISNSKDKPLADSAADFATIQAGEFNDRIVSETLVEILIKQGKKDKAIEVLKKLIWKFPQKKAYFAAQIEELKK